MPYRVQFVGLAFFFIDGDEQAGRRVVLPNGLIPPPGVPPHLASISVAPDAVEGYERWREEDVTRDDDQVEFWLRSACRVVFEGAERAGAFDAAKQRGVLPSLWDSDPRAVVDPERANTIADIEIRQGALEALRAPGTKDDGNAELISELVVPHDDSVTITVTPRKGWPERKIRLRPGTEIAIINTSRGEAREPHGSHFTIYAELSCVPVELVEPKPTPQKIAESQSRHAAFRAPKAATGSGRTCSNLNGP